MAHKRVIEELQEKCKALAIRKREELEKSLEEGKIADPISILISVGISLALTGASYLISSALAPKPPRQERGKLTGSLQLQNSEQGIFIPEIYGAGPTISLVAGSDPTYQNVTNATTGANGSITKTSGGTAWNAGASHNTAITSGQDAFFQFTVGSGYATAGFTLTASPVSGNSDFLFAIQWNPDGGASVKYNNTQVLGNIVHWTTGDVFRVELRSGRFRLYKNSAEILLTGMVVPTPSYPLYMGIAMQIVGAGISNGKVQIGSIGVGPNASRGGIKVPAIIVWSSGIRKVVTTSTVQTGGGKGGGSRTQTVDNITYNIDLGLMFGRGPLNLIREYANADILIDQFDQSTNPSGVYDSTVGADATYDPAAPPDPSLNYNSPIDRVDASIPLDGTGVGTGTIQGGSSGFAVYPGNTTQQADPTIEADIDGRYGTGSTPAYRNHAMIVHNTLEMSRWGGTVPNITAVWEHQSLKTLDDIFASMCERVGVLTANGDYDFTGIAIDCRGLLVNGRPYQPAEVIGSPELQLAYNYFVTEVEGQVKGYTEGTEPTVTIADTEIGWLEGDGELPDILPEVDSVIASEISLPREVHVKSLDPDNDWEPNTASAMRQVTDGSRVELLEIQIAQLSDERRATAQRKLYRDYVAGSAHKITVPWTYLYVHTGYKVVITRAEGFTHTARLKKINGGIGVLEWTLEALEPSSFNQPANGVFPPGYIPPQAIPAMTVVMLLDTPLLRDGDTTNNDGVGQYVVGVPRTGVNQNWTGFALYQFKNNVWQIIGSSDLPGIIGTIVSVSLLSTDATTVDNTGRIVVDLYGTTATLSSVTEADILGGANLAIAGNMVFNFATATQIAGLPNRWELKKLLNGQRETDSYISSVAAGQKFALVNNAVKFIPMEIGDINNELDYRAVTAGQSLGDAATVSQTWTGNGLRPHAVTDLRISQDGSDDWLIEFTGHARVSEEPAQYTVEIWASTDRANPANLKRRLPVTRGTSQAALLISLTPPSRTIGGGTKSYLVTKSSFAFNNNIGGIAQSGETISTLHIFTEIYGRLDFTLSTPAGPSFNPTENLTIGLIEDGTLTAIAFNSALSPVYITLTDGSGTSVDVNLYNYTTLIGTFNYSDAQVVAGLRFSFLMVGAEYRIYQDYAFGEPPLAVIAAPGTGPTFPLRGIFDMPASVNNIDVVSIGIANGTQLGTIYSAREQAEDGTTGAAVLHLRAHQNGLAPRPNGWPFDADIQTIGGNVLLEGGTDKVLKEGGTDKVLKE